MPTGTLAGYAGYAGCAGVWGMWVTRVAACPRTPPVAVPWPSDSAPHDNAAGWTVPGRTRSARLREIPYRTPGQSAMTEPKRTRNRSSQRGPVPGRWASATGQRVCSGGRASVFVVDAWPKRLPLVAPLRYQYRTRPGHRAALRGPRSIAKKKMERDRVIRCYSLQPAALGEGFGARPLRVELRLAIIHGCMEQFFRL